MPESVFQPVKRKHVKGWYYTGGEPDDATILELAKHGVLITYWSTEDNDWDGEYVRVTADSVQRDFTPDTWIVFNTFSDWQWRLENGNHYWEYDASSPTTDDMVTSTTLKDALDEMAHGS